MKDAATSVRERLAVGPPRGLGCANELVAQAAGSPELVRELVEALSDTRPLVTIRAANALEKIQRTHPAVVTSYGHQILTATLRCEDLRTCWNLMEMLGRLPLRGRDRALAISLMFEALAAPSGFLRTFAMSALVQYAKDDAALRNRVRTVVEKALDDPSPAMRARARRHWLKDSETGQMKERLIKTLTLH